MNKNIFDLSMFYAALIMLYIVNVPLTYGYTYNKIYNDRPDDLRSMDSVVTSIFWPIYWPFKLSQIAFSEESIEKAKEPEKYYYQFR